MPLVQHCPRFGSAGDPDVHVANWREERAPVGIQKKIVAGEHFSVRGSVRTAHVDALEAVDFQENHLFIRRDVLEPPSLEIVRRYLTKGATVVLQPLLEMSPL